MDEANVRVRYTRTCSLYNFSSSHGGVEVSRWLVNVGKWGNRMRNSLECDVSALHSAPLLSSFLHYFSPYSPSLFLSLSLYFSSYCSSFSSFFFYTSCLLRSLPPSLLFPTFALISSFNSFTTFSQR